MASTYAPIDAINVAKVYLKNMPLDNAPQQARILDGVSKYIWMAAPWRWTLGALPTITLAPNTQDYPIALPADFLYGYDAIQTDQNGGITRHYEIVPIISPAGIIGNPNSVAVIGTAGTTGALRVTPVPSAIPAGTVQSVQSLYKKMSPVITEANKGTAGALIMDDEWFTVFETGVKWLAYLYGDDQRAGTAEVNIGTNGQMAIKYTGLRAMFEADIQMMRQREKLDIDENKPEPKRDRG